MPHGGYHWKIRLCLRISKVAPHQKVRIVPVISKCTKIYGEDQGDSEEKIGRNNLEIRKHGKHLRVGIGSF